MLEEVPHHCCGDFALIADGMAEVDIGIHEFAECIGLRFHLRGESHQPLRQLHYLLHVSGCMPRNACLRRRDNVLNLQVEQIADGHPDALSPIEIGILAICAPLRELPKRLCFKKVLVKDSGEQGIIDIMSVVGDVI